MSDNADHLQKTYLTTLRQPIRCTEFRNACIKFILAFHLQFKNIIYLYTYIHIYLLHMGIHSNEIVMKIKRSGISCQKIITHTRMKNY